jgi:hypothetical protein
MLFYCAVGDALQYEQREEKKRVIENILIDCHDIAQDVSFLSSFSG